MTEPAPAPSALLLCDDLMWISRVTGTGEALGFRVLAAPTTEKLEALARRQPPRCIIVDLGVTQAPPAEVIARFAAACGASPPRFVAFGSHVDVATLQAARDAGCDPVLPRSKMAEALPQLLQQWLS